MGKGDGDIVARRGLKGASLRGVLMVDTWRGSIRMRAWPKKRTSLPQITRDQNQKWATIQRQWRLQPPEITVQWIEATHGTPFYPRDIYTSFQYGRAAWWIDEGSGLRVYPVAFRNDVSNSLDAIAQGLGDIIVKGPEWWQPLSPGVAGQVLTSNGPDALPTYQTPGGAGGGFRYSSPLSGSVNGFARATRGHVLQLRTALSIKAVTAKLQPLSATATFKGMVAVVTSGGVVTAINKSADVAVSSTKMQILRFELTSQMDLSAGDIVVFLIARTDGTGGSALNPCFASGLWPPYDFSHEQYGQIIEHAATDVNVSDILSFSANSGSFSYGVEALPT